GVEDGAVLVPARHGGQSDPAGAPAVHGRARELDDRGGAGVARFVRVAARRRDPAHPSGRQRDRGESHLAVPTRGDLRASARTNTRRGRRRYVACSSRGSGCLAWLYLSRTSTSGTWSACPEPNEPATVRSAGVHGAFA